MPGDKNKKTANDNTTMDFDIYNDDKTEEIVSGLFDEYIGKGGTSYFADYGSHSNDSDEEETKESSSDDSDDKRKKEKKGKLANKTMIFRKGLVEEADEDDLEAEDEMELESDNTDEADEADVEDEKESDEEESTGINLEHTIILAKLPLSNLFKTDKKEEEEDDDGYFSEIVERRKEKEAEAIAEKEKKAKKTNKTDNSDKLDKDTVISAKKKRKEANEAKATGEVSKSRRRNLAEQETVKPKKEVINYIEEENEDYIEEEKVIDLDSIKGIIIFSCLTALIIIAILGCMVYNYSNELKIANAQISELQKNTSSTYETKIDELQKQIDELQAENTKLKGGSGTAEDPHITAVGILNEAQSEVSTDAPNTSISQSAGEGNTYTVKSGDTIWKISQSLYGNGSEYQKILDANGLNENSTLKEGQVLKIPN